MARGNGQHAGSARLRASKACKACHDRRVKCDASERGIPCSRCEELDLPGCDLIKSRRGTYARRRTRPDQSSSQTQDQSSSQIQDSTAAGTDLNVPAGISDGSHIGEEIEVHNATLNPTADLPHDPLSERRPELQERRSIVHGAALDLTTPDSQTSDISRLSHRGVTWPSMFDHVLNHRGDSERASAIDKCSITYLGETFPLAMVLEDLKHGGQMRLHHPGPPVLNGSPGGAHEQHQHSHMHPEEIDFLRAKGAFEYPDMKTLEAFTSTFLSSIYPCYPIVHRREFLQQLRQKKLPWLLLHSFCFMSATFCPLAVLHRAGFHTRQDARAHYYSKAKSLFDTGYEADKIATLQSVVLLAFWAGGPNDHWNFYSWNSTGVTIAETMGIHRSMTAANLKPEDKNLLRRIWWVLAIRDAACGALMGRPFRINMYFCDTEMLTLENFNDDLEEPDLPQGPLGDVFGSYQIHMAKLSLILREIVKQKYDVKNGRFAAGNSNELLTQWRKDLPQQLHLSSGSESNVFAQCLAMAHDHHTILANLDRATFTLPTPREGFGPPTFNAATTVTAAARRILDLACAIVRNSSQAAMPHECFPALFLAEVVFYAQMRSPNPSRAALGRSAVNTCQMVWHSVADTWDSAPWVMKLFDNLALNTQDATGVEQLVCDVAETNALPSFDIPDMDFGIGPEIWQSHPMLSSIFDLPMEQGQMSLNDIPSIFTPMHGG